MSIPAMPDKAPDELLDYKIDMTAELAGRLVGGNDDTLTGATWTIVAILPATLADLNESSSDFDDTSATIWLESGTLGNKYEVSCDMTTLGGRIYQRSFKIALKDR